MRDIHGLWVLPGDQLSARTIEALRRLNGPLTPEPGVRWPPENVTTPPSLRYRKSQQVVSVWDDSVAPGGYVCSECGAPTESEPCGEHQPERDGECRYHAHTRDGECVSGYDDRDDMSSTPGHPTSPEAAS